MRPFGRSGRAPRAHLLSRLEADVIRRENETEVLKSKAAAYEARVRHLEMQLLLTRDAYDELFLENAQLRASLGVGKPVRNELVDGFTMPVARALDTTERPAMPPPPEGTDP